MLGCPALVALSSRIGRLPVLLLCLAGAATANVWTAMSSSMSSVTLARMLAGMFAASVPVAQAAVTDGGGQDTTSRLALISAAISSGAVVGPALAASLSAFLTARGIAAARHGPLTFLSIAVLAAGTSVVGTLCVAFSGWLRRRSAATWPEAFEAASTTTSPAAPAAQGAARSQQAALPSSAAVSDTSASETAVASFLAPRRRWSAPSLSRAQRLLLPVSWSCGWLVTLGVSTYTLFASAFLGFSQADVGALFSAGALAGVVTQILLLPRLARSIGLTRSNTPSLLETSFAEVKRLWASPV
uniref:Major facilitator superfamily (MFS) profile domain-containing protein n=1 Tax=Chrysotila carterae TaxID=13221 RepID=A0A6S9SE79_CHRCT